MTTIDQLTAATTRFADLVAESDPTAAVPSCPGWTVADLVDHLGGVHQWARHAVVAGSPDGEPVPAPTDQDAPGLAQWYAGHARDLVATLAAAGDDGPAWIFGDGPATAGWWVRRQSHETLMHTRDLLGAGAREAAWELDPALAWDGVDEVASMFYPRQVRLGRTEPLSGTLRLIATDLEADGIDLGAGDPVVEVEAPAADVLLMLWGRAPLPAHAATLVRDRAIVP